MNTSSMRRSRSWRPVGVWLHRWLGVATALFLAMSGLTGAIIAWDHELDEAINPLYHTRTVSEPLSQAQLLALAADLEREQPGWRITFMPLRLDTDEAFAPFVAAHEPSAPKLPFNQVVVDVAAWLESGVVSILAEREWGAPEWSRENAIPFLYRLHYSLHLPSLTLDDGSELEIGIWLMGIVAIVWLVDTLVALWITYFPGQSLRYAVTMRLRQSGYRRWFDLHRVFGLIAWVLIGIMAVTSISMNLRTQVVEPIVGWFSPLTPSPFSMAAPQIDSTQRPLSRAEIVAQSLERAADAGLTAPPGGVFYAPDFDLWGVGFYAGSDSHGGPGLGHPWLYFDSQGQYRGAQIPGLGSAGDQFLQWQFPLHSGRIGGLAGRALVSGLGLLITVLALTGLYIFWRKWRARHASRAALSGVRAGIKKAGAV